MNCIDHHENFKHKNITKLKIRSIFQKKSTPSHKDLHPLAIISLTNIQVLFLKQCRKNSATMLSFWFLLTLKWRASLSLELWFWSLFVVDDWPFGFSSKSCVCEEIRIVFLIIGTFCSWKRDMQVQCLVHIAKLHATYNLFLNIWWLIYLMRHVL